MHHGGIDATSALIKHIGELEGTSWTNREKIVFDACTIWVNVKFDGANRKLSCPRIVYESKTIGKKVVTYQKYLANSMDIDDIPKTSRKTPVACNFCRGVFFLNHGGKKISRLIRKKKQENTYMRARDSDMSRVMLLIVVVVHVVL